MNPHSGGYHHACSASGYFPHIRKLGFVEFDPESGNIGNNEFPACGEELNIRYDAKSLNVG